jgi:hypothetical protein
LQEQKNETSAGAEEQYYCKSIIQSIGGAEERDYCKSRRIGVMQE